MSLILLYGVDCLVKQPRDFWEHKGKT